MSSLGDLVLPSSRQIGSRRLAHELKKLVGWGLSEHKLRELKVILDLPNVRRRAGEGQNDPAELALAAYELIREAVGTFESGSIERQVFRLLLVLDDKARSYLTADDRRRAALRILAANDKKWHMSEATWRRDHEVDFLEKLALRMLRMPGVLTSTGVLNEEGGGVAIGGIRAEPEDQPTVALEYAPDPRKDYKTLSIHTVYKFTTGRVPDFQETVKTVQALKDGVDRWREGGSYTVSNDAMRLEVLEGAKLERELRGNFYGYRFWDLRFPEPLREGEIRTLRVRKVVTDRRVEPLPYFTFQARWPVELLTMRVEFARDCLPQRVARIFTPTFKLPEATASSTDVPLEDRAVETTFVDLHEGVSYGFLWTW